MSDQQLYQQVQSHDLEIREHDRQLVEHAARLDQQDKFNAKTEKAQGDLGKGLSDLAKAMDRLSYRVIIAFIIMNLIGSDAAGGAVAKLIVSLFGG